MDAYEAAGEEAGRKLHKNVESSIKQVLATTPHETSAVRTLAPITKTIQVRRTRHAGHCWRSKDELISDVLLWTPTHGCARVGRPARTYIQQLCEDTGCNPEDLPEAMNDRERWRETVRDIRAGGATWWWWWLYGCHYLTITKCGIICGKTISNTNLTHTYTHAIKVIQILTKTFDWLHFSIFFIPQISFFPCLITVVIRRHETLGRR